MSWAVRASEHQRAYLCFVNIVVVDLRKGYGGKENSAEEELGVHDYDIGELLG